MSGHNSTLGGGGFHHMAINVHDFDKSVRMYQEAFGFTHKVAWGKKTDAADSRAVMLDTGDGNFLEIFAGGPATPLVPAGPMSCNAAIMHVAFRTTRIDEIIPRARAAGFTVTVEPKDVSPNGDVTARIAFVHGPDGEVVEFFQGEFF